MFPGGALPSVAHPLVSLFHSVVNLGWFYSSYIEPSPQPQIHRDATQKLLGPPLCLGPYVWCFILQIPAISADSNFNLGLLSSMRPPCSSQMPLSGNCPQAESWTIMRLTSGFLCSLDCSVVPAVVHYLEIVASYSLSSFIVDFGMRSSLVSGIVV